ncbi:hypothetical protein SSX86_009673 [Deinandra increscens subsp. villosa]|uniref:RING-type domain-containing protein n=1 Tax=Deinandra increscens subsp. villosa TaxID=3103831 RepID=A0AAP0DDS3_9ASTR
MSKLFHSRRIRFGARNDGVDGAELDSYRRTATTGRRHHHRNNRLDLGGCNPPPRRIHRHHLSEHEEGVGQSQSGSIINSEDFRSIRRWGAIGNDRLPGVVLLARERLVERLRGVHVSQNRYSNSSLPIIYMVLKCPHQTRIAVSQSSRSSSSIHQEDFSYNNLPMSSMTKMLPPGLSKHELTGLQMTVFNNSMEGNNETASSSRECSICLEGFEDGDELINLDCMHRFHSCCLFPWIEVCGACPNCRKDIVVTSDKPVS